MADNKRFTIMTFPQHFDGVKSLRVNVLFLPRGQNPFKPAIEATPPIPDTVPAFVNAKLTFQAAIIKGLGKVSQYFEHGYVQTCSCSTSCT